MSSGDSEPWVADTDALVSGWCQERPKTSPTVAFVATYSAEE
jgi:hypothetical protein